MNIQLVRFFASSDNPKAIITLFGGPASFESVEYVTILAEVLARSLGPTNVTKFLLNKTETTCGDPRNVSKISIALASLFNRGIVCADYLDSGVKESVAAILVRQSLCTIGDSNSVVTAADNLILEQVIAKDDMSQRTVIVDALRALPRGGAKSAVNARERILAAFFTKMVETDGHTSNFIISSEVRELARKASGTLSKILDGYDAYEVDDELGRDDMIILPQRAATNDYFSTALVHTADTSMMDITAALQSCPGYEPMVVSNQPDVLTRLAQLEHLTSTVERLDMQVASHADRIRTALYRTETNRNAVRDCERVGQKNARNVSNLQSTTLALGETVKSIGKRVVDVSTDFEEHVKRVKSDINDLINGRRRPGEFGVNYRETVSMNDYQRDAVSDESLLLHLRTAYEDVIGDHSVNVQNMRRIKYKALEAFHARDDDMITRESTGRTSRWMVRSDMWGILTNSIRPFVVSGDQTQIKFKFCSAVQM